MSHQPRGVPSIDGRTYALPGTTPNSPARIAPRHLNWAFSCTASLAPRGRRRGRALPAALARGDRRDAAARRAAGPGRRHRGAGRAHRAGEGLSAAPAGRLPHPRGIPARPSLGRALHLPREPTTEPPSWRECARKPKCSTSPERRTQRPVTFNLFAVSSPRRSWQCCT